MFDARLRTWLEPFLNAIAARLHAHGLSANMLTAVGFACSLFAFVALARAYYGWALCFLVSGRLMDGLDGPLARQTRPTDLGGFLDIVCDFIFYSGMVFFFAVGRPEVALAAAFLIFSFVGSGTSFLAYAIMAAKRGVANPRQRRRSFYYLWGVAEGSESIAVLAFICIFPEYFSFVAYGFGGICWVTAVGRVWQAAIDFS